MASEWIKPVTNRTKTDVNRIKILNKKGIFNLTDEEREEWNKDSKGALNKSDLERIENDIQILSDTFEINLVTYDGNIPEIPTVAYYKQLRENVQALRDQHYVRSTTPLVPDSPLNDYEKWNDIEYLLKDIKSVLDAVFNYYCYSDAEIYAGEEFGLLL